MKRCIRLPIVFTVLLLAWLGPIPGRAQSGDQQPSTVSSPARPSEQGELPSPKPMLSSSIPPANRGAAEQTPTPVPLDLPAKPSQLSPLEVPPPAGGEVVKLPLPPLEPGDLRFPINLATALRLSDARPLIVVAAQAAAWVAEAQVQEAWAHWLPDLNLGFDYIRHDGNGPDTLRGTNIPGGENAFGQNAPGSFGRPQNQNINFFYTGAALFYMQYLTDDIFAPLAARQNLNSARWNIQSAKNDALLATALAYFDVHKWRGTYAGAIDVVIKGRKLVAEIDELRRDLVPQFEVDRARNFLADMEQQAVIARQYWRRSSANLTQVLRLDPRAVVEPLEPDHLQITMIEPDRSLDDLMQIALTNRPELASRQALVQAALVRIRQEKLRPILPIPMVNGFQTPYEQIQVGAFGIGNGGKMNLWYARDDVAPGLAWQFANLGLGNAAMVKWRRGEASQATVELFRIQDMVVADVTRSQALLQSAAARVVQAERELRGALINYKGVVEGLKQTQRFGNVLKLVFRVPDAVFSLQLLKMAYDDYWTTVAEYNQAQFRLFHALGYPAREVAYFRRTGEILPVNTMRPGFLPPVGTGPPPPTR
jgi:outer membrane protein TolC